MAQYGIFFDDNRGQMFVRDASEAELAREREEDRVRRRQDKEEDAADKAEFEAPLPDEPRREWAKRRWQRREQRRKEREQRDREIVIRRQWGSRYKPAGHPVDDIRRSYFMIDLVRALGPRVHCSLSSAALCHVVPHLNGGLT